jgi:VanZ family protein
MNALRIKILIPVSGILFILLFSGGFGYYSKHSYKHAWDMGHVLAFSVWTYLLLLVWKDFRQWPFLKQFISVFLFTLSLGILIEYLQVGFQRTPEIGDVMRDLIGSLITLSFISPSRKTIPIFSLRLVQTCVALMFLFGTYPLARALTDEYIAKNQFPLLSDFETAFEIDRWGENPDLAIHHNIAIHGESSLKVPLRTELYSGVSLLYFPRDWRNFHSLKIAVFNPSVGSLTIGCRINDIQHFTNGGEYNDRYNASFLLRQGWNTITITIGDIANAPLGRKMDMSKVQMVRIYVKQIPEPGEIYIDHVRLEQ